LRDREAGYCIAMAYEPLHHKYRPQTFAQLVGQDAIATTLANALRQQRIAPAYLFSGPRGTGKTSSARILAKSLNCIRQDLPTPDPCGVCETCRSIVNGSALDFIEIDAASNTGVDNIRELIERAQFAPAQCRYKVYVIDECHMLSTAAFNALLKTLEEPPSNVVFVLATTDPQRVLPTIISRCQRFDYRRIPLEPMLAHLQLIATQEKIDINDEALRLVAQISQGGLRDAQSLLDQLSLLEPPIESEAVWDLVGAVPERDLFTLVQGIVSDNSTTVLDQARKLMDRGREPLIVLQNLAGFYRDLLIAKTAGDRQDLVAITPSTWAEMQALVQAVDARLLLLGQQHLRSAEVQVKNTTQPRLWLEVTLMGLLPSTLAGQIATPPASVAATAVHPSPNSVSVSTPQQPPRMTRQPSPSSQADSSQPLVEADPPPLPSTPSALPPRSDETADLVAQTPLTPEPPFSPSDRSPSQPPTSNAEEIAAAPASPNLNQLWQQVLAALQPLGTRALMQQQGSLLSFDGTVARIGISSKPLFKMAQGRVPNVEAAFEQVIQQQVTVSLEVLPDPKPGEPDLQAAGFSEAALPLPAVPPLPATLTAPSPTGPAAQLTSPEPQPTAEVPQFNASRVSQPDHTDDLSANHTNGSVAELPQASLPEIGTDFERAVKNFAHFFNGQVVDMDDDVNALISGGRKPSDAAAKQPSHPDKDVPF
jgi:DNA polymerase-3 subunit gamma/tau